MTALYAAMHYPHVFGAVLAESPSLWIAEGRFLGDMWAHGGGALPERLFLGCGTKEYSATRDHDRCTPACPGQACMVSDGLGPCKCVVL